MIERLKAEKEDFRQGFIRQGCEIELLHENVRMRDDIIRRQHKEIKRLESRLRDRGNALDHAIDYGHRKDAEIERLRANVHLAYYEGWDDAKHTFHIDVDVAWDRSEAKAALEEE